MFPLLRKPIPQHRTQARRFPFLATTCNMFNVNIIQIVKFHISQRFFHAESCFPVFSGGRARLGTMERLHSNQILFIHRLHRFTQIQSVVLKVFICVHLCHLWITLSSLRLRQRRSGSSVVKKQRSFACARAKSLEPPRSPWFSVNQPMRIIFS